MLFLLDAYLSELYKNSTGSGARLVLVSIWDGLIVIVLQLKFLLLFEFNPRKKCSTSCNDNGGNN